MYFGGKTCNYVIDKKEKNKLKQRRSSNSKSASAPPPEAHVPYTSSSSSENYLGGQVPSINTYAIPASQRQDDAMSPREVTMGAFPFSGSSAYPVSPTATSPQTTTTTTTTQDAPSPLRDNGYPVVHDFEIRRQIEDLVKLVAPDAADKVDVLLAQFGGKEEELLKTLQLMERKLQNQIRKGGGGGAQNPPPPSRRSRNHHPPPSSSSSRGANERHNNNNNASTTTRKGGAAASNNNNNEKPRVSFQEDDPYDGDQQQPYWGHSEAKQEIEPPRGDSLNFGDVQENPFDDFDPNEV